MCHYGCVYPRCKVTWDDESAKSVSHSHGLCPRHGRLRLLENASKQQRTEGVPDCAGKSNGYCANHLCTYFTICLPEIPSLAEFQEFYNRQSKRRTAKYGHPGGYTHHEVMMMAAG